MFSLFKWFKRYRESVEQYRKWHRPSYAPIAGNGCYSQEESANDFNYIEIQCFKYFYL